MEVLLAIGAAVSYGVSDYTGGVLTRRAHVVAVFLLSQIVSLALLAAVVALSADAVSWPGITWGAAAGLAGVVGTSLLYQGLAIGRMSVVAPITGVLGAALPVLIGLAAGERPGPVALTGIVCGLLAVVVTTRATGGPATQAAGGHDAATARSTIRARQALLCAFGAGVGFGLFFVLLARSPQDSGLWPMLGTRLSQATVLGLVAAVGGRSLRTAGTVGLGLLGLGVAITLADLLFLLATRGGLLSLVAVITSMYPAVTVALAALVLRERITGPQWAGLGLAAVSVALIAIG